MRILVAITGASGAIYTQRLLDRLNPKEHEIHVITSSYGQVVMRMNYPMAATPRGRAVACGQEHECPVRQRLQCL